MFRTFAVAAAVLATAAGAGTLAAQTSAPSKPTPQAQKSPAPTTNATAPAKPHAWSKAEITEAQQGLAKAGYFKGKPTGEMNADTKKALKAFEKANNLPATGRLSDTVLAKLKTA
jgi:peptidoglycan hydrolase-like protein with peptidoglycan-binding domain